MTRRPAVGAFCKQQEGDVDRLDTIFSNLGLVEGDVAFGDINPNSAKVVDIPVDVGAVPGDMIISWCPGEPILSLEDAIVQFLVIQASVIRVTILNPSGMIISVGTRRIRLVFGRPRRFTELVGAVNLPELGD